MDAASLSSDGYDADFLGVPVPFPSPASGAPIRELPYTHFTVNLDPLRGLASATGVNIDGDQLVDVGRGNDWHLDSRIPEQEQTGEAVYARNDLDRGHLVRRRDPVWGDGATASQANYDTFAFTNAAPQAAGFNQSKELWLGLEDHVLEYARTNRNRISVFTAPVLGDDDPVYRGVGIPQLFWKIAAWATTTDGAVELRAAGFVLDQRPQLADVDLDEARAQAVATGAPPPLGPFRTFQVPIVEIDEIAGLTMDALSAADVLEPVAAASAEGDHEARWVELSSTESVRL
ncbi:DNA/RNA non-specific endonuclease [Salinibacterium sp. SWN248]|uniref:DNA/RNA non-specific endonuclease n=1 Tax=Salinibacterium sp. SWN248 TaxID=2792056 RepID=UPI0018CDA952|nr:DNA/RNA non-specific endonuclease [Salinibacterium sp. SWN248]MBH0024960.1 DNA/RNA non-specific endonuclease [Salinibacterium sp. SWN248]